MPEDRVEDILAELHEKDMDPLAYIDYLAYIPMFIEYDPMKIYFFTNCICHFECCIAVCCTNGNLEVLSRVSITSLFECETLAGRTHSLWACI